MLCHCSAKRLTDPDGEEGNGDEDWSGDGAHSVGPATGAVHEAVEEAQLPLKQRRAPGVQDDLEVALQAAPGRSERLHQAHCCKHHLLVAWEGTGQWQIQAAMQWVPARFFQMVGRMAAQSLL